MIRPCSPTDRGKPAGTVLFSCTSFLYPASDVLHAAACMPAYAMQLRHSVLCRQVLRSCSSGRHSSSSSSRALCRHRTAWPTRAGGCSQRRACLVTWTCLASTSIMPDRPPHTIPLRQQCVLCLRLPDSAGIVCDVLFNSSLQHCNKSGRHSVGGTVPEMTSMQ